MELPTSWPQLVACLVLASLPASSRQLDWDRPSQLETEDLRSAVEWLRRNNPDLVPVQAIDKQAVDSTYSILLVGETGQWRRLDTSPPADLLRPAGTGVFVVYGKTNQVYMVLEIFRSEEFRGLSPRIREARRDSVLIDFLGGYGETGVSIKYAYDLDRRRIDARLRFCRAGFDPPVRAAGRLYYKSSSACGNPQITLDRQEFILAVEPRPGTSPPAYGFVKEMPSSPAAPPAGPVYRVERGEIYLFSDWGDKRVFPVPVPSRDRYQEMRGGEERLGGGPAEATLTNEVGPFAVNGSTLWFANTFYDGEGTTGVGGIGSLDLKTGEYNIRHFPEIARWSGSALLVDGPAIWVGLVCRSEGAPTGGGLLRYHPETGQARRYEVPGVISSIDRAGEALYLATSIGLYLFRNGSLTLMRLEPVATGRWDMVTRE